MRIGTIEFESQAEYNAGLRDYNRIQRLKLHYDMDDKNVASMIYRKLKQQTFYFESEVGKSFMRDLAEELGPSGRGLGVGIKRRGFIDPEEQQAEELILTQKGPTGKTRNKKSRQPSEQKGKKSRVNVISYFDGTRPVESKTEKPELSNEAELSKESDNDGQEREKKKSANILMKIAAIVASAVLLFSIGKEAVYRYQIYQSGLKIQALQEGILSPITTVSEESSVILDKIALASEENAVVQTGNDMGSESTIGADNTSVLYEYSALYERNQDMIGWIEIPGTVVNYPVMQTKDDQNFYLRRDFDKENDVSGLPFIDARSDVNDRTTNLLIYGHNMRNGTMFATLLEYKDRSFYEEHKTIIFNTIYEKAEYEIIASFRSSIAYVDEDVFRYYNFIDASTKEEFNDFINNINALAGYDTGVNAEYGDELLTLSTCDKSIDDGRYVVVAKKITN